MVKNLLILYYNLLSLIVVLCCTSICLKHVYKLCCFTTFLMSLIWEVITFVIKRTSLFTFLTCFCNIIEYQQIIPYQFPQLPCFENTVTCLDWIQRLCVEMWPDIRGSGWEERKGGIGHRNKCGWVFESVFFELTEFSEAASTLSAAVRSLSCVNALVLV